MIILEDVLINGFDNRTYRVTFHVKPGAINVILTPALFNKERLAKIVLGLSRPEHGKIVFLKELQKKCYYNSTDPVPYYKDISSYVEEYVDKNVLERLLERTALLGYKVDRNTRLYDIPMPLRVFMILFTLINSDNELCVLIDPFEYLDDVLINLVEIEMMDSVKKNKAILIITSNESVAKRIRAHNLLDLKTGLQKERVFIEKEKLLSSYVLIEVHVKDRSMSNPIPDFLGYKGFRGFIMGRDKIFLLVDKRFRTDITRRLSRLTRERRIGGFRVVEVE